MVATQYPQDPLFDGLTGQFSCSYRFYLIDFPTQTVVREIFPVRDTAPVLSHDVSRTIVRELSGLYLDDASFVNVIRHRVRVEMIIEGRSPYLLGTFMFSDKSDIVTTAGSPADLSLYDSMFLVDHQIPQSYAPGVYGPDGTIVSFRLVQDCIGDVLASLPIQYTAQSSPFYTIGTWTFGANRGSILGDLSLDGDYFAPWVDNEDIIRFIRVFDPSAEIPRFDYDAGYAVDMDSITRTNDLIDAPNRFIVVSNESVTEGQLPVVGFYEVPASAPHSFQNRGFYIDETIGWQVDYPSQAQAIAANFGQRQTVFERVTFSTTPDPRHDSYDVFHFLGSNWLEISWQLPLTATGKMLHTGRRVYV